MPIWIAYLRDHWLSFLIAAGAVIAVIYVIAKRSLLFYKE